MGASGIYAMVTVMNPEMVPSSQWGTYVAITSVHSGARVTVAGQRLGIADGAHCTNRRQLKIAGGIVRLWKVSFS
jgi:hypothetical protein